MAALALVVVSGIIWSLLARRHKRQKLLTGLLQALHAEVASALADPVLVHQARRVISWRSGGSSSRGHRPEGDLPPTR
jgi:hypothetical protein